MAKDYIPQNDAQLAEWLKSFSDELLQSGTRTGITPAEIASLNALISSVIRDLSREKSEETEFKKEAMLFFLFNIVEKMKQHPAFDESNFCKRLNIR